MSVTFELPLTLDMVKAVWERRLEFLEGLHEIKFNKNDLLSALVFHDLLEWLSTYRAYFRRERGKLYDWQHSTRIGSSARLTIHSDSMAVDFKLTWSERLEMSVVPNPD